MGQPEFRILDHSKAESGAPLETSDSAAGSAAPDLTLTVAADLRTNNPIPDCSDPPPYYGEALKDAERLLKYAAETGIEVEAEVRDYVLRARRISNSGWDDKTAAQLLEALTTLAVRLRPVTAQSIKAGHDDTRKTVRGYRRWTIWLAIFIVPLSVASFVTSAISTALRTDISTANDLAVKLTTQLSPLPPAPGAPGAQNTEMPKSASVGNLDPVVVPELQQYASEVRSIDARARQLRFLVNPFRTIWEHDDELPKTQELPPNLSDLRSATVAQTASYQKVRFYAQNLLSEASVLYGALATCILPVLYALLGTCAFLLRTFEQQMSSQTFTPTVANSARFLIAAIGGAVVGLFNNFTITQQASIPPLAIAFLVGYAVDVFFAFLEGLLQQLTRNSATTPVTSGPSGTKA
jgi:hypothetical protein